MSEVLFAAESLVPPVGGADRFPLEVMTHMAAAGARVRATYIAAADDGAGPDGPHVARARAAGVELLPIPSPEQGMAWTARLARAEAVADAVTAEVERRRPDVVVTQQNAEGAVVAAASAARVSTVVNVIGYEAICHWRIELGNTCRPETRCHGCPRVLALPPAERVARLRIADGHAASLRRADTIVAPSQAMAAEVHASCGRQPEVVHCIGPLPQPVAADPSGPVVAVSALWTQEKGGGLLAPIARRIAPRRLVVQVGDAGRIVPIPMGLGDEPNVELRLGPAESPDLLAGAAALLVPSQLPEPFGRIAVEGLAAGVPVLASATGGLVESVPERQLIDRYDDPGAWAEAIAAVLEPVRWEEARAAGLAAAQRIEATKPVESFAALVERLV